jgi:hypothetical protein
MALSDDQQTNIEALLFGGQKIEAIKQYRKATGLSLREAKDAVETIEGALRAKSPEQFRAGPQAKGCFGAAAVFCVVLVAIGYWMTIQLRQ